MHASTTTSISPPHGVYNHRIKACVSYSLENDYTPTDGGEGDEIRITDRYRSHTDARTADNGTQLSTSQMEFWEKKYRRGQIIIPHCVRHRRKVLTPSLTYEVRAIAVRSSTVRTVNWYQSMLRKKHEKPNALPPFARRRTAMRLRWLTPVARFASAASSWLSIWRACVWVCVYSSEAIIITEGVCTLAQKYERTNKSPRRDFVYNVTLNNFSSSDYGRGCRWTKSTLWGQCYMLQFNGTYIIRLWVKTESNDL